MATLFGVGLPFSRVLLKENSVEIREVRETVWRDYWKEQTGRKSYPLLFDITKRGSKSQQESASQGPKHVMSTEAAAEYLGVGVEGLNEFTGMTTELNNVSQNVHTEQPEWLSLIYNFLWEEGASDWHSVMTAYSKELNTASDGNGLSADGPVSTSGSSANAPKTFLSISNNLISLLKKSLSGFGLDSREKSGSQIDYRQLRLTVKVYLDSSGYSFSKLPETAELPFDRESGKVKIRVSENTLELSDYEMVPTVVLSFFYDPTVKNSRGKRLLTSLNTRFQIDSCNSDENVFGWYHDRLRLSFSCRERNEVMRETRPPEEEILSQHERRFSGKERGSDNSTVVLKRTGKEYELHGGYRPIAEVRVKGSTNNETTKGNISRDHFAHQIVAVCLKDANFAIKNVEAGSQELAYEATIFPPISFYDMWDFAERQLAEASGMMGNVELEVEGKWIVKWQDDTLSSSPRLCAYEFLCQRRLAQHREVIRMPVKTRKFWKQEEGGKKEYTETLLQQKLSKQFLLNHSFSHMNFQKFQRLESYEWDMAKQTFSPLKEIIDLPPSSASSSLTTTSV